MVVTCILQGFPFNSKSMKLTKDAARSYNWRQKEWGRAPDPPRPPIYISTSPSRINPEELRDLYHCCNLSCHQFPNRHAGGLVEPVDIDKLCVALSHSSFVVSVFCKPQDIMSSSIANTSTSESRKLGDSWEDLFHRMMPVTPSNGQLVGFGRAVSDLGLTANIYDVMVIPSLRKMGIGRMIVERIIRMLSSKEIYDIAALCSEEERLFFEACGFGDDILGSTTMMYCTKAVSSSPSGGRL